jgi:hypothetical protein
LGGGTSRPPSSRPPSPPPPSPLLCSRARGRDRRMAADTGSSTCSGICIKQGREPGALPETIGVRAEVGGDEENKKIARPGLDPGAHRRPAKKLGVKRNSVSKETRCQTCIRAKKLGVRPALRPRLPPVTGEKLGGETRCQTWEKLGVRPALRPRLPPVTDSSP